MLGITRQGYDPFDLRNEGQRQAASGFHNFVLASVFSCVRSMPDFGMRHLGATRLTREDISPNVWTRRVTYFRIIEDAVAKRVSSTASNEINSLGVIGEEYDQRMTSPEDAPASDELDTPLNDVSEASEAEPNDTKETPGRARVSLKSILTIPVIAAGIIALLIGGGAGAAIAIGAQTPTAKTHLYKLLQAKSQHLSEENSSLTSKNNSLIGKVAQLQTVSDQFDSEKAGLAAQKDDLAAKQKIIDATVTQIQANTVPGDGTYLVGSDIQPGTYRSISNSGCYWARLSDLSGTLGGIITNNNADGQVVVTIRSSDKAFESKGCSQWLKIG